MRITHRLALTLALLLLLEVAAGAYVLRIVDDARRDEKAVVEASAEAEATVERMTALANREVAQVLGYLRGAASLEDINATRADLLAERARLDALLPPGDPLRDDLDAILAAERALINSTVEATGMDLLEVLGATRAARAAALNESAAEEVLGHAYLANFAPPGNMMVHMRGMHLESALGDQRTSLLAFETYFEDGAAGDEAARETAQHVGGSYDRIIENATDLAGVHLGMVAAAVEAKGASEPDLADEAARLRDALHALQAAYDDTSLSNAAALPALTEEAEARLLEAEAMGVDVPRADVEPIGAGVSPVVVLSHLALGQARLAITADTYLGLALAAQEAAADSLDTTVAAVAHLGQEALTEAHARSLAARDRADAAFHEASLVAAAAAVLVSLPAVAFGLTAVRRLRRRLDDFDTAARSVAQGRRDVAPPLARDEFDGLAVAWRDMTVALEDHERVRAHTERRLAHRERIVTLGSLVAGVAHEINNPLTFIKGNQEMALMEVEALLERPDVAADAELKEALEALREDTLVNLNGIERIRRTNSALKGFAAPGKDEREPMDLHDVVDGVLIIAHNQLKQRFQVSVDRAELPTIRGSPHELGQVVLNLILNAAEAAPDGSTITIATRREGDHVALTVRDEGPGVPSELRPTVFQEFVTTKDNGTGLGLAISRSIAHAHGGTLVCDDVDEGGSFTLSLPIAPTPTPEVEP